MLITFVKKGPGLSHKTLIGRSTERRWRRTVCQLGFRYILEGHQFGDGGPEDVEVEDADAGTPSRCVLSMHRQRER